MTSRERVIRAIEHKEIDRVPLDLGGSLCSTIKLQAYRKLQQRLGLNGQPEVILKRANLVRVDPAVLEHFGIDVWCLYIKLAFDS